MKCRALLLSSVLLWSQSPAQDRGETEARLKELNQEIKSLQNELESGRKTVSSYQEKLKSLDLQIQRQAKAQEQLAAQQTAQQKRLDVLQTEQDNQLKELQGSNDELAKQVLSAWRLGRESRLKLILNQDSPAKLSRTLAYYDYFSAAQADQIHSIKSTLATLDENQQAIENELEAMDETLSRQAELQAELQQQRQQRAELIASARRELDTDQHRLDELVRNRSDLESILERLSSALADIPDNLEGALSARSQKGKLPMPVRGRVLKAYGQQREAGLRWQGWLIESSQGTRVHSVAHGRVAYADWLRGYGLLMIIDHGDEFMSLYGYNEALLVDVGDWVDAGSAIATAGSQAESLQGTYFELRSKGKAIDPASWINR